ncbi:MAG: NAD(P)-dependent oxidoreductase [Dethiobacter sp.]|jgi:3-hydroxyisobutyrate dehydrogenase-like beta-hydroxyacid dehydrogenase|nr:NAD(P)-dependent oxidoreductase [Dethiobacter sp.]
MKKTIGFIGLGTMGAPMALRLVECGYPLLAYDSVASKVSRLAAQGAIPAASPREAAARAEIIILMLPLPKNTEAVVLGKNGIIEEISAGKIVVDMSTSSPTLTRQIYREVRGRGGEMLDAPVSGGQEGASYCLEKKAASFILPDDFTPGFTTDLLLKDMELAMEMGEQDDDPIFFGKLAHHFFRKASNFGLGSEDNSAVIKIFREMMKK